MRMTEAQHITNGHSRATHMAAQSFVRSHRIN